MGEDEVRQKRDQLLGGMALSRLPIMSVVAFEEERTNDGLSAALFGKKKGKEFELT